MTPLTPMTPEQERVLLQTPPTEIEVAELTEAMQQGRILPAGMLIFRRLCWQRNAEHERAERLATEKMLRQNRIDANARDAARWRAVREEMSIEHDDDEEPWLHLGKYLGAFEQPWPVTVDEAADRLIAELEARDETG